MISNCPSCRAAINVPPEAVGKKVRCTGCQAIFVIETPPPEAPPPPPMPAPPPSPKVKESAIQKEEPKRKLEPAKKKPAPVPSVADPAGPSADFSFDNVDPADKVNVGVRLRASAAAGFMSYGVFYAVIPAVLLSILAVVMSLATLNPILIGVGCFMDVLFIIAAVIIVVGAGQLRKMRSYGMAMTGAIFSVLLGLSALVPLIYLSILTALIMLSRMEPSMIFTGCVSMIYLGQFGFSTWGGIRAILVLRREDVRRAMGTSITNAPAGR